MKVIFHKSFIKMAQKLSPKVKQKMSERIELFASDPLNSQLRTHALYTHYKGSYSIDITGDYRAIYQLVDDETALFTHIGTHSQLYR
jgi:addiction module RelE/StbE family toxin